MGGPDSASPHNSEWRKKRRPVVYPRLHEAFFVWMKAIEREVTITGAILKAKAADLFSRLYPNETVVTAIFLLYGVWGGGWGIFVWGFDGEGDIYEYIYTIKDSLH